MTVMSNFYPNRTCSYPRSKSYWEELAGRKQEDAFFPVCVGNSTACGWGVVCGRTDIPIFKMLITVNSRWAFARPTSLHYLHSCLSQKLCPILLSGHPHSSCPEDNGPLSSSSSPLSLLFSSFLQSTPEQADREHYLVVHQSINSLVTGPLSDN